MQKETIKKLILQNRERMPFQLFERHIPIIETKQINVIIGLRRAGKTFFLYQTINDLLAKGVPKERILLINFEDERLATLKAEECGLLMDAHYELYPNNLQEELYLFFDEIHIVPGWEKFVSRLFEDKRYRLTLTGSSSKLLSKEIATNLRGRSITTHLFPLSFAELCALRGIRVEQNLPYSQERFKAIKLLDEYLVWGGFYEVQNAPEDAQREKIVKTYLDLIVYKDLVERYGIKNVAVMKQLVSHAATNTTKRWSLTKLHRDLSRTMKVSKNTISQYLSFLEDANVLYPIKNAGYALRQNTIAKYYLADTAFKTVGGTNYSEDKGLLYENAVLIELLRREEDPYFYSNGGECDFVLKQGTKMHEAIQVTIDPEKERERKGLLAAMEKFKLKQGIIITAETEKEEEIDGKKLRYVPLWRWLLKL